jgi:hypothetical protein
LTDFDHLKKLVGDKEPVDTGTQTFKELHWGTETSSRKKYNSISDDEIRVQYRDFLRLLEAAEVQNPNSKKNQSKELLKNIPVYRKETIFKH